jgi:dTDP-4-dehydrorhamnose 3,5-epimerase
VSSFAPVEISGIFTIALEPLVDERGWFVRVYDEDEFAARGLCTSFPHHAQAYNFRPGTIRGLHWQRDPHGEIKVIRCVRGAAFDVLVDVRTDSPTYGRWLGFELSAEVPFALYVPAGIAHGYQTLRDETELHYLLSERYHPSAAAGVAFDSSALDIAWPLPAGTVSERDRALPPFVRDLRITTR